MTLAKRGESKQDVARRLSKHHEVSCWQAWDDHIAACTVCQQATEKHNAVVSVKFYVRKPSADCLAGINAREEWIIAHQAYMKLLKGVKT